MNRAIAIVACVLMSSGLVEAAKRAPQRAKTQRASTTQRTVKRAVALKAPKLSNSRLGAAERAQDHREMLAATEVREQVAKWVPKGQSLVVRTAVVQLNGNPNNPITGAGPVEVYVKQVLKPGATFGQRLRHIFSKFSNRQFTVNVDAKGNAAILSMRSYSWGARMMSWVNQKLNLRQIGVDVFHAKSFQTGLYSVLAGSATFPISPMLTGAAIMNAVHLWASDLRIMREVRKTALTDTVKWASAKTGRKMPTLSEVYRYYSTQLDNTSPGTHPLHVSDFAAQLALHGL